MPARQFWTTQHPIQVDLSLHVPPDDGSGPPHCTLKVLDQSGACMVFAGATLPPGFAAWAFADAARAAVEAWELASPEDAARAFKRACAQWVRDAKALLP